MQNSSFNFHTTMNSPPPQPKSHQQIDRFPSQNSLFYNSPQFYQPLNPSINPPPPPTYGYGGCSDYEQRLWDEVLYLHSLWRRGPPHTRNPHLKPLPTTSFKKKKKKNKPNKAQIAVSDKEWPVDPKAACPSPPWEGWGEFKAWPAFNSRPASVQEQERVLAVRVQLKGLDSCIGLFRDSDDDDDDDDDEEDYDEEEAFEFFLKVFEEDEKLRGYYKTKFQNGEFYCLVCGVIGNKLGRKYKDCVALVQHSVSTSKTKKRTAHRAYGRAVCKFLGWDIDHLPSLPVVVANDADVETQSLEKPNEPFLDEDKNNVDASDDKPTVAKSEGDAVNTSNSQAEPEKFTDAVEKDSANRIDGHIANQQRDIGDNLPSQSMNETGTIVREA